MRTTSRSGWVALLVAFAGYPVHAVPLDETVECQVLDPEFHDGFDLLLYQHINGSGNQEARVKFVDPDDQGTPVDGTEAVLDNDVAVLQVSQAGPKFSHGKDGAFDEDYVVYTREVDTDIHAVGLRKALPSAQNCDNGTEAGDCFPNTDLFRGQIPKEDPDEGDERRIVYSTEEETYTYRAQAMYHRAGTLGGHLSWAPLENFIENGGSGLGEESFAEDSGTIWGRLQEKKIDDDPVDLFELKGTTVYHAGTPPSTQIFLIDAVTKDEELVTSDLPVGFKFNPYLFRHLELDRNMVVYRHHPLGMATRSDLVIYWEPELGTGEWEEFATLTWFNIETPDLEDPLPEKFLLSPESFVYDGKTYLVFYAANDHEIPSSEYSSIWYARIDANGEFEAQRISPANDETSSFIRVEPEVYFRTPTSLPIFFYTQYTSPGECNSPSACQNVPFCLPNFNLHRITLTSQEML